MTTDIARNALVALRLTLGAVSYLKPDVAARLFGIDPTESAALPSSVRLFGAREAAMGVAILGPSSSRLNRWLTLGIVVDSLDIVTVALGARRRDLGIHTTVVGGGLATLAVGLGVRARLGSQARSR
jgi:hypothetical protein